MEQALFRRRILWLGIVFVLLFALVYHAALRELWTALTSILAPVLGGLAAAFVLNLPLRFFERLWVRQWGDRRQSLRRIVCLLLCLFLLFGLAVLICWAILPRLLQTLGGLLRRIREEDRRAWKRACP